MKAKPRVLIINRGEVAVRLIRACQELGYVSILAHSTPDIKTSAYRMADETVELLGQTPLETYLHIEKIIQVAKSSRADLLHPGFGFLSENAEFVERLEECAIKFIGPSSQTIRMVGNKIKAKEMAIKAGVPVTQAYLGPQTDPSKLLTEAQRIGFPCIIKAACGGGGKGMKVVLCQEDFKELLASAQREAQNAFGSSQVFIEKYLENPRHIEVQILADKDGHTLHFYERDCTIQRRHQKVFEETPSEILSPKLRQEVATLALKMAKACSYKNAGTVEFLLDAQGGFYFMELNTRLQVEHGITEMVCGVDLVKLQFLVAMGESLASLTQGEVGQRGHALEVRIYAENPAHQFLPSTGEIALLKLPLGPQRRFDFGYEEGDSITPFYDPMIGKIITWAQTREENIKRMHATLCETVIFGVETNIEFLKSVLQNKKFIENKLNTSFLEVEFGSGYQPPPLSEIQAKAIQDLLENEKFDNTKSKGESALRYQSPWAPLFLWENSVSPRNIFSKRVGSQIWIHMGGRTFLAKVVKPGSQFSRKNASELSSDGILRSPMPGKVLKINVVVGQIVKAGVTVCVLEAMKMEYALKAPFDGKITRIFKRESELVDLEEKIVELEK